MDFGIIAYRTDSENLTVYTNQPHTRTLDAKLRKLKEKCSPLVLRCCRIQPPIYKPHSLRAGCRLDNGRNEVSGTMGVFAKQILNKSEKDVGITSGHVIWEGCSASVNLEGGDKEIGHCTWPPKPVDGELHGNILDMAVIEVKSDMTDKISTTEDISLYTAPKGELEYQMVFKRGCTTGKTDGDIEYPQFNMFGRKVMVITTADGQNFSESGDSGALVLTKKGSQLLALGLVFGEDFSFRDSDENFPENASIAVYLDEAISRFEENDGNGVIRINRY